MHHFGAHREGAKGLESAFNALHHRFPYFPNLLSTIAPPTLANELIAARVTRLIALSTSTPDIERYNSAIDYVLRTLDRGVQSLERDPQNPFWLQEDQFADDPVQSQSPLSPARNPLSPSYPLSPLTPLSSSVSMADPAPEQALPRPANAPAMPARGHATAPDFDPTQPRTLRRFFQDIETLFERCGIVEDQSRKQWVVRYMPIDVADLCETLATFSPGKTYEDFRTEIKSLYPGAEDERKYTIADVKNLVARHAANPIRNITELSSYYREFFTITSYLIKQKRLSESEQSRLFVEGITQPLWDQVQLRLQIKLTDHYPDDPYPMNDVYEAAKFVLHGTLASATAQATQQPSNATNVKVEDLAPLLKLLAQAMNRDGQSRGSTSGASSSSNSGAAGNLRNDGTCHYCGNANHRMANCEHVEEDIKNGLIARNAENKIVLANGTFVPRSLPGLTMRDRVYEWHRRNKANNATTGKASSMLLEVAANAEEVASDPVVEANFNARIDQLEREIMELRRKRVFDGVEIPVRRSRPQGSDSGNAPTSSTSQPAPPATSATPPSTREKDKSNATKSDDGPEYPFAKAKDAIQPPPQPSRAPPQPQVPAKDNSKEVAYRNQVPIYQPKLAEEVFARSMKTPTVTLTPEELLSISPEVRNKFREAITPKRVPAVETRTVAFNATSDEAEERTCTGEPLEPGGVVVPDPYSVYINHFDRDGPKPAPIVARESHSLRSIVGLVNNQEYVEAIVDPGCQIIAMSRAVCHSLGLAYDPTVRLDMQSANGELDKSEGLLRNVPFRVGNIQLYLQIHVIRDAAYDILLGRPFDVLTRSVVKNYANEDQTITIACPNSGEIATVPTIPRGSWRARSQQNPHAPTEGF